MSSSNWDEPYDPQGEDTRPILTPDDIAAIPPIDEAYLLAWARQRRRLWLLAVPGLGLIGL